MLLQFRVKNFRSFKDNNEFSMIKGKQRFFEDRISEVDNNKILKFSAIFGANASGKSNLVRAIKVMQFMVLQNNVPIDALNEYFKLDDDSKNQPSYFEVVFSVGENIFSYGFEVNLGNRIIESEWLFKLHKKLDGEVSETMIFEKRNNSISFAKQHIINPRLEMYKADIQLMPTRLLLSHVASFAYAFSDSNDFVLNSIIEAFNWFQSSLRVLYTGEALFSPELSNVIDEGKVGSLLSYFDTGIKAIGLTPANENEFRRDFNNGFGIDLNSVQNTLAAQKNMKNNKKPSVILRTNTNFWIIEYDNNQLKFSRLEFYHDEEKKFPFKVSNESDGTIRLFELADALLNQEPDKVIIVDELDRCLHPVLTVQFVKQFLGKVSNINDKSQFIVTTHESRLMDLNLLRRDEIWFVKKENNISHLYSLEEYNVRFDKVIDNAYLDGRYGGIPVFDNVFFPEYVKHENSEKPIGKN